MNSEEEEEWALPLNHPWSDTAVVFDQVQHVAVTARNKKHPQQQKYEEEEGCCGHVLDLHRLVRRVTNSETKPTATTTTTAWSSATCPLCARPIALVRDRWAHERQRHNTDNDNDQPSNLQQQPNYPLVRFKFGKIVYELTVFPPEHGEENDFFFASKPADVATASSSSGGWSSLVNAVAWIFPMGLYHRVSPARLGTCDNAFTVVDPLTTTLKTTTAQGRISSVLNLSQFKVREESSGK